MLIVPIDERYNRGRVALATWIIVLINAAVFLISEPARQSHQHQTLMHYYDSGLARTEYPFYLSELSNRGEQELRDALPAADAEGQPPPEVAVLMLQDHEFQQLLERDQLIRPVNPHYAEWRPRHDEFVPMLRAMMGSLWALDPAQFYPWTLLSYQFLHGSLSHLMGNMLILMLVGQLVEAAVGLRWFLALYLGAGVAAGLGYGLLHWGTHAPMIGASGAISGMMAAFAVLFAQRKVRFFYTAVIYAGFAQLPALALLPYWLLWELLSLALDSGSGVAYEAHFFGLLAGAAAAWWLRRLPMHQQAQSRLDAPEQDQSFERELQEARRAVMNCQLPTALRLLDSLQRARPQDPRPVELSYIVAKCDPASPRYHRLAAQLIAMRSSDAQWRALIDRVRDEYVQDAMPELRLPAQTMMPMLAQAAQQRRFKDCDRILAGMRAQDFRSDALIHLLQLLARSAPEPQASAYQRLAESWPGGGGGGGDGGAAGLAGKVPLPR